MDFNKRFATDKNAELEGSWQIVAGTDCELLIARHENKKYLEMKESLYRPHFAAIRDGSVDVEVLTALYRKVCAGTILLGWKNLEIDGEVIEYSFEAAIEMLKENDFFDYVLTRSKDRENYTKEYLESSAKNLSSV